MVLVSSTLNGLRLPHKSTIFLQEKVLTTWLEFIMSWLDDPSFKFIKEILGGNFNNGALHYILNFSRN